jgi:CRISPR-associated protein Cas6
MPKVDVSFSLSGRSFPLDHGYCLYGAISRRLPGLHGARWLGVHPLSGKRLDANHLVLGQRPELRLRIPLEHIPSVLPLVGCSLDIAGHPLMVGVPTIHGLDPSTSLDARLVVIKLTCIARRHNDEIDRDVIDGKELEQRYLAEGRRQLDKLEVTGEIALTGRRSVKVAGRRVVGFSVRVTGLSEAGSIRLQEEGLGGKRAMGCGIFRPTRIAHG